MWTPPGALDLLNVLEPGSSSARLHPQDFQNDAHCGVVSTCSEYGSSAARHGLFNIQRLVFHKRLNAHYGRTVNSQAEQPITISL
jgi:hypothetical protein